MNNIVKVNNVNKKVKDMEILKNISFKIPKGCIFAFLGANGAGKSTLISILVELIKPTSGEIIIENNGANNKNNYSKIGIVFQDNVLDDELTVYDNLMIRGSLYKIDKKVLKNNVVKIIELLNMEGFINKKYGQCSGGQKRIAMIARAVIIEPSILVLDEPTVALDPMIRKMVWDIILKLNKEKEMTIFFSSHYLEEAYYANYICILNKGKILFEGERDKLLSQSKIKKLIIKEHNSLFEMLVDSIKDGMNYLNSRDISNVVSISLGDISLEEIFIRMMEEK
ncbi:MAG: ABC transporter ATP-binding protein [Bacilli bacterium]|nr:ABC transporter ATP-binding protein [Bacilli bacterium]